MKVYIMCLFLSVIVAYITDIKKTNKWMSIFLVCVPLGIVSACRWNVGTDFSTYYYIVQKIQTYSLEAFFSLEYNSVELMERGFCILVWLLGKINSESQFIIGVIGIINIVIIIYVLKKYSKSYTLSVYLYITTMSYFSSFNGIRQSLACALVFLGIKLFLNRNTKKYILYILLISTIHISALIMIPIYFLTTSKPFSKRTIILIVLMVIITFALSSLLGMFTETFSNTKYEGYASISNEDDGVNILRVLVSAIPVVLSYFYYIKSTDKENKESNILINLSIINLLILIIAMKKTVIARFCMYLEPYNILLYPMFLKMFNEKQKNLFVFGLMVCFFAYMYLLLPAESNLLPYVAFWQK